MAKKIKAALKADITKLTTLVTPKGIGAWAYLDKVAEGIDRDKQKITVFFDPTDPEFINFGKKLIELDAEGAALTGAKAPSVPSCLKRATEKEASKVAGVTVGQPYMEFSTNPRFDKAGELIPIPVAGPDAKPTEDPVWSGDIVRVQTAISNWSQTGKRGLKGYLNGVQLLKSNRTGGNGLSMFSVDETFLQNDETSNPDLSALDSSDNDDLASMFESQ